MEEEMGEEEKKLLKIKNIKRLIKSAKTIDETAIDLLTTLLEDVTLLHDDVSQLKENIKSLSLSHTSAKTITEDEVKTDIVDILTVIAKNVPKLLDLSVIFSNATKEVAKVNRSLASLEK